MAEHARGSDGSQDGNGDDRTMQTVDLSVADNGPAAVDATLAPEGPADPAPPDSQDASFTLADERPAPSAPEPSVVDQTLDLSGKDPDHQRTAMDRTLHE